MEQCIWGESSHWWEHVLHSRRPWLNLCRFPHEEYMPEYLNISVKHPNKVMVWDECSCYGVVWMAAKHQTTIRAHLIAISRFWIWGSNLDIIDICLLHVVYTCKLYVCSDALQKVWIKGHLLLRGNTTVNSQKLEELSLRNLCYERRMTSARREDHPENGVLI